MHYSSVFIFPKTVLPFIKWDLGVPVVKGARDIDVLPSSCPADHSWTLLVASFHQVIQIWRQILLYWNLGEQIKLILALYGLFRMQCSTTFF